MPSSAYGGGINSERLEAASVEMDMVSDLFNRMVKSCHAKCVDRKYLDPTLNNGESKCADRCGTSRHVLFPGCVAGPDEHSQ
jgi:import inner membrane translocase subunit TIM10